MISHFLLDERFARIQDLKKYFYYNQIFLPQKNSEGYLKPIKLKMNMDELLSHIGMKLMLMALNIMLKYLD